MTEIKYDYVYNECITVLPVCFLEIKLHLITINGLVRIIFRQFKIDVTTLPQ